LSPAEQTHYPHTLCVTRRIPAS